VTCSKGIKRAGGRVALATDCQGPQLQHYLSLLDIDDLIDIVVCGSDVERGKTDPGLVAAAIARLGVAAHEAVMIGDTPSYDAEAATARAAAAGVLTGGFAREALFEAGCIDVAENLAGLAAKLNIDGVRSLSKA
jgi:phosphoglycolate phosphatase-like HAD superfamily hydrolase